MRNRLSLVVAFGIAFLGPKTALSDVVDPVDAASRARLIESIIAARERAGGRPFSSGLKHAVEANLSLLDAPMLETLAQAGGLGDLRALTPSALGDAGSDLVFTPVAPCRIVNTTVAGGVIPANTKRAFFVNGNVAGTFETQGGQAGGCGIPDDATSVEMNFVAVGPSGAGDLRAFPFSAAGTAPNASVINYASLPGLNIANAVNQPVCNAAVVSCPFDLYVQADAASTHLVVDVVGFYRKADTSRTRSFVTVARVGGGPTVAATCTNFTSIVLNAPSAGQVLVRADVAIAVNHTAGAADQVVVSINSTPTDCQNESDYGFSQYTWVDGSQPTGQLYPRAPAMRLFAVNPGATTFYVNAVRFAGSLNQQFFSAGVTATFFPN